MYILLSIILSSFLLPTNSIAHESAQHRCLVEEVRYSGEEGFVIDSYIDGMECGNGYFIVEGEGRSLRSCGVDLNHRGWVVRIQSETSEIFRRKRQAVEEALYLRDEGKCLFPDELFNY